MVQSPSPESSTHKIESKKRKYMNRKTVADILAIMENITRLLKL